MEWKDVTNVFYLLQETDVDKKGTVDDPFPDDAFLLVSQVHWEDDVVWNGDDIKHKARVCEVKFYVLKSYFLLIKNYYL